MIDGHAILPPAPPHLVLPIARDVPMDGAGTHEDPVREERMVGLLEALHGIRAPELEQILEAVAAHVAEAFGAGLADVFVYDPDVTSLVARGTSPTPLGRRRRALGLDRLPLVSGGRAVATYRTGVPHLTGRADADPEELRGLVEGLGVRSVASCAILVGGERRGVLSVAAAAPDAFDERDLRSLAAVAGWVGLVMERAELVQQLAAAAERRGYARAGDELARLTGRQRDVAALVADGRTNAEIAASLGLTEGTVANHMEQAMRRLELRSRAQLAVWAYRHGLYRPDDADEPLGSAPPTQTPACWWTADE
jgi:DNA-binding CsgD family transcriptional regulator